MDRIQEIMEVMGKLDATDCSSEDAIADYILANVKSLSSKSGKRAFVATAIQAYAKLLQNNGVKVA